MTELGIDVGGTTIRWAVCASGEVTDVGVLATPDGASAVLDAIAELVRRHTPHTVGLALPGLVSADGVAQLMPNLGDAWRGLRVADAIEESTGVRPEVCNDARAFAHAELRQGAAVGVQDAVFVTLGTGVGGALAVGGEVLGGPSGRYGELGHQRVTISTRLCGCGNRGCAETVAGLPGLLAGSGASTLEGLVHDVGAGHSRALRSYRRAAAALGQAAGAVSTLLAPELVVVGGGVATVLGGDFLELVGEEIERHVHLHAPPSVVPAVLGADAGAIGAALVAREGSGRALAACRG